MKSVEDIKIYLLDFNPEVIRAWKSSFQGVKNVEVVNGYFEKFIKKNSVQVIVSPANAFGLMDGGYDLAITKAFGDALAERVQKRIIDEYCGEQPVGTVISEYIDKDHCLYHIPTMRYPQKIKDHTVVYQCTRAALMQAMKDDVNSIVIPAFGGACGGVPFSVLADMMRKAYFQLTEHVTELNWDYVSHHEF